MTNSKQKGARMERLVASMFRDYGYDARRSAQYCGNTGDAADLSNVPYLHCECKHQEQFRIYDWMAQAVHDSQKSGNIPTVIFKKNNHEVLVTMRFDDFMKLYKEYEASVSFGHCMNPPEGADDGKSNDS